MVRVPGLIVIGAARSGTTALYEQLRQHPQIFLSPSKEANYFAFEGETLDYRGPGADFVNNSVATWDDYLELFADAPSDAVIGDISPLYLYAPKAAERIRARLPDAKLVAILRNPIEQAFSHFQYARAWTIEPLESFDAALDAEPQRLREHWQPLFQYSAFPRYAEQIRRFQAHFPPSQLKIFLYEDYRADPHGVLREIFEFAGVDANFVPTLHQHTNAGGDPRSPLLQSIIMRPNLLGSIASLFMPKSLRRSIRNRLSRLNVARSEFSPTAHARLVSKLRPEILELQGMLGRDLSAWLEPDRDRSSPIRGPNQALEPAQRASPASAGDASWR
jgi:hypothetical protein